MSNVLSVAEIVEIGIEIEKNGKDFYGTLISQSKNDEAKEIFQYLAGEEEKHIIVFQEILNSINNFKPVESYPGEYTAYINSLASEHIFTQKDKGAAIAKNTTSDKQAINLGIGLEKDSIIFYEAMKKIVPEDDQRIIDRLIIQEQNHLTQLTELKKTLLSSCLTGG